MARSILARRSQRHRCADRDSPPLSISECLAWRVDLWPLDHGAHESGTLRLGEPPPRRFSLQDLRRGARTNGAMVEADPLGVVHGSRCRRILLALRSFQWKALPGLERICTHSVSSGNDCSLGLACRVSHSSMEEYTEQNTRHTRRQTTWACDSIGSSCRHVSSVEPRFLPRDQPRQRRTNRSEPA